MPSLVGPRDMNSYGYERGGPARVNGLTSNGGFQQYRDGYGRDDEERYRRGVRNGGPSFDRFNTDYLDQNSVSDFRNNEPKFELDHLATFAAGARNGVIHAEDGLRKLRQMENTTGIWTMRCNLLVERNYLVILDNSTGEELERFPIQLVQDPTAIFKNDRREIYNNLILFTVADDPNKRLSQADMHIFQSSKAPAQEIVDEIIAAKSGQQRLYQGGGPNIPPPPAGRAPEPPSNAYNFQEMREYLESRQYQTNNTTDIRPFSQFNQTSYSQGGQFGGPINQQRSLITRINTVRERESIEGGSTEILERDVQLLNHCFDDIEKFVARLQQAAESYKELERRKRDRGAKNKKRQPGDGMLNARAKPPPDRDFVDIFQKFKLSFNLLAKLKAHIHDPNAPELVHFLFTPLSLIYEASRDPFHGNQNLGDQAVTPVLTGDAKQLLLNCLTSKEIELWQALGKHWTTSRDEWQGNIPPYVPEFYDGWHPAAGVFDEPSSRTPVMAAPVPMVEPARTQLAIEDRQRGYTNMPRRPMAFPDEDRPLVDRYNRQDEFERFEPLPTRGFMPVHEPSTSRGYEPQASWGFEPPLGYEARTIERSTPRSGMGSPYSTEFIETHHIDRNVRSENPKQVDRNHLPPGGLSRQEENNGFYDELRRMGDVLIYEAVHDRIGKNAKELTIQRGDILQVLDSSKNWWKLRNYKNQVGFAPYTILKAIKTEEETHFEHNDWNEHSEQATDRILNGPTTLRSATSETSHFGDERGTSWRDRTPDTVGGYLPRQRHERRHQSISPPRPFRHTSSPHRREESLTKKDWSPQPRRRESRRRSSLSPVIRQDSPEPQKQALPSKARGPVHQQKNRSPSPPDQKHDERTLEREASQRRPQKQALPSKAHGPVHQQRNRSPSPPDQKHDERTLEREASQRRPQKQALPSKARGPVHQQRNRSPSPPDQKHEERTLEREASQRRQSSPSFRRATRPSVVSRKLSPPKSVPPPPPAKPRTKHLQDSSKNDYEKRHRYDSVKSAQENLHEELQTKLTSRHQRSFKSTTEHAYKQPSDVTKITQRSSASDVMDWIVNKGFSNLARDTFRGYTGSELFRLRLSDLEELLGHEEAIRLDGLITLQKKSSGYATKSAKELNDILRIRKKTAEPEPEVLPYQQRQEEELRAEAEMERTGHLKKGEGNSLQDQLVNQKSRLRQSQNFDYD